MKKVLVIGIKGMAGHVVFRKLQQEGNYDVYGVARSIESTDKTFNLDVIHTDKLKEIIAENQFDAVINCIGILNKDAEDHPAKAIWFNSYFPHFLEDITKNSATKVIHISTDCVFSGKDAGGYTEESFRNGIGFYAQSKALGEITNGKDLTIRTSIIGPELNQNGIGLFHWFMFQSSETQLGGFTNVYWSGITTIELAKVIIDALEKNVTGLKQISREKISKYNLLKLFNEIFRGGKMNIVENPDYYSDKSLVSIRNDYEYQVPDYVTMLEEMKTWIEENEIYDYKG
ncbi:SDR family oxidoreductase [Chryseobacterium suipulveris]|uniref:dTDP-4-dehydrorhamnose reductase n=1 Tax=Chryseobacterium suipulveris TaxID=2929800 RepID=A0ABY4BQT1_9FLAO|nr:SDR family oxidoreductase [Chryseobacterium suipulveris]UOE41554.1 SDR family oxidoreductase [Chryseobacterium suipulveris]